MTASCIGFDNGEESLIMNAFRKPIVRDLWFWFWAWMMLLAAVNVAHNIRVQGLVLSSEFDSILELAVVSFLATIPARIRNAYVRGRNGPLDVLQEPQMLVATQSQTNGFAIASLVLGITWVFGIGSVLALVFGYRAKRQITRNGQNGRGMSIAGIILGWVGVVGLVAIVAVVSIFPFTGSRPIPQSYVAAQRILTLVSKNGAAGDSALKSNDLKTAYDDFFLVGVGCLSIGKHFANGPDEVLNRLLKKYSTDCEDGAVELATWVKNGASAGSLPEPIATNLATNLASDAQQLKAEWVRLGYENSLKFP